MSDREDEPTDLFDAICRLDDVAEWLMWLYPDDAEQLQAVSTSLKGQIVITLKDPQ